MTKKTVEQRFLQYVQVAASGCWLWTGFVNERGYGKFRFRGKKMRAHRVAWILFRGEVPDGLKVCHTCDVTRCVNPDHLFVGTQAVNLADMRAKGRHACDTTQNRNKLQPSQVLELRQRVASGEAQLRIAEEFGVGPATVWNIVHRRTWADLYEDNCVDNVITKGDVSVADGGIMAKQELIQLRVSGDDKVAFQRAADQDGKTLSAWFRDLARRFIWAKGPPGADLAPASEKKSLEGSADRQDDTTGLSIVSGGGESGYATTFDLDFEPDTTMVVTIGTSGGTGRPVIDRLVYGPGDDVSPELRRLSTTPSAPAKPDGAPVSEVSRETNPGVPHQGVGEPEINPTIQFCVACSEKAGFAIELDAYEQCPECGWRVPREVVEE